MWRWLTNEPVSNSAYTDWECHDSADSSQRLLAVFFGAKLCSPLQVFGGTSCMHIQGRNCPSTGRSSPGRHQDRTATLLPAVHDGERRTGSVGTTRSITRPCFTSFFFFWRLLPIYTSWYALSHFQFNPIRLVYLHLFKAISRNNFILFFRNQLYRKTRIRRYMSIKYGILGVLYLGWAPWIYNQTMRKICSFGFHGIIFNTFQQQC